MTNKTYVLIDFENRPIKTIGPLSGKAFHFVVFRGKKNVRSSFDLLQEAAARPGQFEVVSIDVDGKNALDFCLVTIMGSDSIKMKLSILRAASANMPPISPPKLVFDKKIPQ